MILVVTCVNVYRTWPSKGRPAVSHARHCGSLFSSGIFFDYGDVSYDYVSVYMRRDCRHMTSEILWNKSFYFIVVS